MSILIVGVIYEVFHCFGLALARCVCKILDMDYNIDIYSSTFWTYFLSFAVVLPIIIKRRYNLFNLEFKINAIRALMSIASQLCLLYSMLYMPIIEVSAITLTYPLVTVVLAVIFLKEKIGIRRVLGTTIGLLGGVIIVAPEFILGEDILIDHTKDTPPLAMVAVFMTVFLWGVIDILTKWLTSSQPSHSDDDTKKGDTMHEYSVIVFFNAIVALPAMLYFGNPTSELAASFMNTPIDLTIYSILGVASIVMIFWFMIESYKKAELCILVPLYFTSLVFTAIISYFAFGEVIKPNVVVGSIIVILSSIYIAYREYIVSKEDSIFKAI